MKRFQKLTAGITLINKKYKKKEFYHYFQEPSNVIIIPIFKKKFVLVCQKREPINKINYEFPMGWIDKGETPIKAGGRELLEETGFKSQKKLQKLIVFYADPGRGSRSVYCFFTKNLKKIKKKEKGIVVKLKTKKEILQLIKQKKFNNASHISAFLYYLNIK